ncbi:MAG: hypothetical protein AAF655_23185 [Bacteroidota bacterium]
MKIELPHIDKSLWNRLKLEAKHRGMDVSDLFHKALLDFFNDSEDIGKESQKSNFNSLAGTWSEEDAKEFENNTTSFREIDPEMWK